MLIKPIIATDYDPILLSLDAMATRFELVLYGDNKSHLRAAGEDALEEIASLDKQLSRYRPDSDISWINAHAAESPVRVEPRLFELLKHTQVLSEATYGAFDITVGPLMRVWGFIDGNGNIPTASDLESARELVGMQHIHLNSTNSTISFDRPGVEIDLGAIGKGYAIERAVKLLIKYGLTSGLIHGGTSTIYALDRPPYSNSWKIGIRYPSSGEIFKTVELVNNSLSVSGIHRKSFKYGDAEYGHIIDPRVGTPSNSGMLAAVSGSSPTDTDALSTALLVLGKLGKQMISRHFSTDISCLFAI